MATRRSALGRGLGALISTASEPSAPPPRPIPRVSEASEAGEQAPLEIAIERIVPNPEQPRRVFDPEQLRTLADSIRQHGVLQPVVVRRAGERFELVVGERRWRAAREAGRTTLPAVVSDLADRDLLAVALVENVQRHDLNPIELAHAFKTLAEAGETQDSIGRRVGLERSTIANHLRLLELSRDLQEDVESGRLSFGHGKALLQMPDARRRTWLRDRIIDKGLSVREAEGLAREASEPSKRARRQASPAQDPDIGALVDSLRSRLQTKVQIQGSPQRGRLAIDFYSVEELGRIASCILDGR